LILRQELSGRLSTMLEISPQQVSIITINLYKCKQ
jgi:hypothetical protein